MKCPNCGAEMKEDSLYCEHCGEDIHIVPDFEPELEQNIVRNMEPAMREATGENKLGDDADGSVKSVRERHTGAFVAGWIGIAFLVLALIGTGVGLALYYSSSFQIALAQQSFTNGNYEKAINYYQRAIELDPADIDLLFSLAEVYYRMNDKDQYTALLQQIIDDPYSDDTQIETAYGKLIAVYKAQGDYQSINDMLLACGSDSIRTLYADYIPQPPEFSIAGGTYDTVKALKITADGDGMIYYTLDGSDPNTSSSAYDGPILLEDGEMTVRAIYVDENGVSSEIAEAVYVIDVKEVEPPVLNLDSGEYNLPVKIEVKGDTENVYYTTDGSTPTINSTPYTEPIPMKPGTLTFRFVRIEEGISSSVEERIYTLELFTDFTVDRAVNELVQYLIGTGRITDAQGHFEDSERRFRYECQYALRMSAADASGQYLDESDYYILAELLVSEDGSEAQTGSLYAANAYTGTLYQAQTDEYGNFTLTKLAEASEDAS